HHRGAVVGTAQTRRRSSGEEHRLGKLALSGAALAYNRDGSKPPEFLHSHRSCLSNMNSGPAAAAAFAERAARTFCSLHVIHPIIRDHSYAPSRLTSP